MIVRLLIRAWLLRTPQFTTSNLLWNLSINNKSPFYCSVCMYVDDGDDEINQLFCSSWINSNENSKYHSSPQEEKIYGWKQVLHICRFCLWYLCRCHRCSLFLCAQFWAPHHQAMLCDCILNIFIEIILIGLKFILINIAKIIIMLTEWVYASTTSKIRERNRTKDKEKKNGGRIFMVVVEFEHKIASSVYLVLNLWPNLVW